MSGRQASFLDGGEQAIPVPAGLGQVGIQFEEFGTRLNFIPIVLGNGRIHLEVEPEVSVLNPDSGTTISGATVPGRTTQRVRTTVEIESGQTLVIGGLIQHRLLGTTTKTPVLGELPIVGAFFSFKRFTETESELLVVVTPHLVDPIDCAQYPCVLPGQETRTPDDYELFLEGILEAPRGPRPVCRDKTYVAAYKNGPTAELFPCAGDVNGYHNGNGYHGGAMDSNGFVQGGLCPTCPGGSGSVGVQLHTTGKMSSAPLPPGPLPSSPLSSAPATMNPPEAIPSLPVKPATSATRPAVLPPMDSPVPGLKP